MKKKYLLIAIPVIILSCYYDNEERLYPDAGGDCDTTEISFQYNIKPILSTYCYACHSNKNSPSFGNNIHLEDYKDVINMSERMVGALNHEPLFVPMPRNGNKLNDCLILKFEAWLDQGSQDN